MSAAGTARKYEPRVPEGVDVTRPSIARIYDYLLYGKDNFAADRAAAQKLMESRLEPRRLSLANRAFLRRAVDFLAHEGVAQYLDLGSGLPTSPSVHEVARDAIPAARVVYVDHDPIVGGRGPRSWTCSTASTWSSPAWSACRSGGPRSTPTGHR